MKKGILIMALSFIFIGGCSTSSLYVRARDYVYPPPPKSKVETPKAEIEKSPATLEDVKAETPKASESEPTDISNKTPRYFKYRNGKVTEKRLPFHRKVTKPKRTKDIILEED